MTAPIAIELVENAISAWMQAANPGIRVHFVEPELDGAPLPDPPAVQIQLISGPIAIGQPDLHRVPSIMQQRITVTGGGPGTTGVDFRLGFDLTSSLIEAALLVGDDIDAAAVKLLAELAADLPAGVTAIADPEDTASIIVTGSAAEPLFSCAPSTQTTVATLVERFPTIQAAWSRMTWRVGFRSLATRGFGTGADMMAKAKSYRHRVFGPAIRATGWQWSGELQAQPSVPTDRGESLAVLDFALEGFATIVFQSPAIRQAGIELELAV